MNQLKKILLLDLPPALEAALEEQFADSRLARASAPSEADLVIGGVASTGPPGVPVLRLEPGGPKPRLGALLRQAEEMLQDPLPWLDDLPLGPHVLRPRDKLLLWEGAREIPLTDRETGILALLARHPHRDVTREELLRDVWRYQDGIDTHTLETHVWRLRQKTGGAAGLVATGEAGYRLNAGRGITDKTEEQGA